MRAKKIILRDAMTRMPVIVIQFEKVDEPFCKPAGFGTGLKVVLKFGGKRVMCIAGYEFAEKRGRDLEDLATPFEADGTISSFGEILDRVDNILHLPDELNVEETRMALIEMKHSPLLKDTITEELDDYVDHSNLRKVIYQTTIGMTGTALIDIGTNTLATYYKTTADRNHEVARYLWIPVQEATVAEVEPFKAELEFRKFVIASAGQDQAPKA